MSTSTAAAPLSAPLISGRAFPVAYVDDLKAAHRFYHGKLGLELAFEVPGVLRFYQVGEERLGILIHGGATARKPKPDACQGSFTLKTPSTKVLFAKLKRAKVTILQPEGPMDMGDGDWWFSVLDPAGNIVGFLGGV